MVSLTPELDSLSRVRYFAGVGFVSILYDHLLTLDDEISTIWTNPHRDYLQKLTFAINRYYTEAVAFYAVYVFNGYGNLDSAGCRRFMWVLAFTGIVFSTSTQFFVIFRIYHSWDRRKRTTIILWAGFGGFISASTTLLIITVVKVQSSISFVPGLRICALLNIPSTFPWLIGLLLGFNVFLILLTVFNALERPHRTNADILDSLHNDGAKLFLILSSLSVADLIMTIVGTPADIVGVLIMVGVLNSVIASRIHLRTEGLKLVILAKPGSSVLLI